MKKLLIVSFDLEVGGVERSLISLLNELKGAPYSIDLFLYRHTGEFMKLIPEHVHLLPEIQEYTTFRKSIAEVFKDKNYMLANARLKAKWKAAVYKIRLSLNEPGYRQMQDMWMASLNHLPPLEGQYDLAVSYLWPHYTVLDKVNASNKAAWIHTDFSTVEVDSARDEKMWSRFDTIIGVSESCREAFLKVYPALSEKTVVIENMSSPESIELEADRETAVNMDKEGFKIVTIARFSYAKGIDLAIEAVHILGTRGVSDFTWYMIGYGGDEPKLKELVKHYGLEDRIIFLGKKINPFPYLKLADLYVQPSRYEGKAVTVTEAQIMKLPILITKYPTASSQVEHGKNGYITDLSPEGIAEGIAHLKQDDQAREALKQACTISSYSSKKDLDTFHSLVRGQL
jgi:glycosyltransferase involved in cell wall biosynthesis